MVGRWIGDEGCWEGEGGDCVGEEEDVCEGWYFVENIICLYFCWGMRIYIC